MRRSGFGGRQGSISSRSSRKIRAGDRASNFLNLVKSIAGGDLLFCLEPDSINVGFGEVISSWTDSLGAFDTQFIPDNDTRRPSFNFVNNKPVVSFNGTDDSLRSQNAVEQLNDKSALSLIYFAKANGGTGFDTILELAGLWYDEDGFAVGIQRNSSDFSVYNGQSQGGNASNTQVGAVAGSNGTIVDVDLPIVHGVVFDRNAAGGGAGTSTKPFVNGVAMTTSQIYTGGSTTDINTTWGDDEILFMAARGTNQIFFNGSIGTFIAITRVLTDAEMETLSRAVARKHNLGTTPPNK